MHDLDQLSKLQISLLKVAESLTDEQTSWSLIIRLVSQVSAIQKFMNLLILNKKIYIWDQILEFKIERLDTGKI